MEVTFSLLMILKKILWRVRKGYFLNRDNMRLPRFRKMTPPPPSLQRPPRNNKKANYTKSSKCVDKYGKRDIFVHTKPSQE